jgi:GNAT superfamily N-acetyltransferase
MNWKIRLARPSDADAVERLLGDFAAEDGWPRRPIDPAERRALGRGRAGKMVVWLAVEVPEDAAPAAPKREKQSKSSAAARGVPFGFVAAHEAHDLPEGPGAWLSDLYVAKSWRRRGVGRALLAAVAAWSRARGGRWIMWHTDPGDAEARRFYASIGGAERPTHLLITLKGQPFLRMAAKAARAPSPRRR